MAGAARRRARPTGEHGDDLPRIAAVAPAGEKKSLHAAERDTERVQTLRTAFRETVHDLAISRLKCVAESGTTLAMPRR